MALTFTIFGLANFSSAQEISLSPWPVTVITIFLPLGNLPAFLYLIKPAIPAADDG